MQLDSSDRQQGAGTQHVPVAVQPVPMRQQLLYCRPVIQQLPVPQTTQFLLTQLQDGVAPSFCKRSNSPGVQHSCINKSGSSSTCDDSSSADSFSYSHSSGLQLLLLPLLTSQQEVFPPLCSTPVTTHQDVSVGLLISAHPAAFIRQLGRPVPQELVPGHPRVRVGFGAWSEFWTTTGIRAWRRINVSLLCLPSSSSTSTRADVALQGAVRPSASSATLGLSTSWFRPGVVDVSSLRRVNQVLEMLLLPGSAPLQLLLPLSVHLLLNLCLPLPL